MKLTKRFVSLCVAILMLCSGLAVTSFADGETTEGTNTTTAAAPTTPTTTAAPTTTAPTVEKHVLNANNCYVDVENIEIIVKAAKAKINGTAYDVIFTATQVDDATKTLRGLNDPETGNTIFTNPVTGKKYKIEGTVKIGEAEYRVAEAFVVEVLNSKSAPSTPVAESITSTSIKIKSDTGCEYRIKINDEWKAWQDSNLFTGLNPDTFYPIQKRYKKTATHYASAPTSENFSVKTLIATSTATPDDIRLVDKTNTSLTVAAFKKVVAEDSSVSYVEVKNVQFSKDDGKTWQNSGEFKGLKAETTYKIVARYIHSAGEEAYSASAPKEFITNSRESYPADIKKTSIKVSDGDNYANEHIDITVIADTYVSQKYNAQYGDTRYIPAYYTVKGLEGSFEFTSKDGITYTSSFIPGDSNANKAIDVNVYFAKEKCVGEVNGVAVWERVGAVEVKTCKVNVGEVHNFFTDVKNFFLGIFDALFNTIPAKLNEMLKGFDLAGMLNGMTDILKALEGVDLGGLTGGTQK